ncbi:MAG: bifunctional pyr operon transcriptional regulator/uracil phosphoribosyltransferase PyrR [Bacteroidetes bacterium]|nr:bifunctional pyr operon transcriptional regulator/uracil phosphoribosyltransferase PyrR [Bacteroidota bacterium]
MAGRIILSTELLQLTLKRLCHQIIENYDDFSDTVLIGLQVGGVPLVERIAAYIKEETGTEIQTGKLDITFYRDDFRTREKPLEASTTDIEFMLEDKRAILVDDVLYTGRSVRAAMDAMLSFGRPKSVELLVLIDRRFNRELPIQPDYVGLDVDTIDNARVSVNWQDLDGQENVRLLKGEKE